MVKRLESLELRVTNSLRRLDFELITVIPLGDGRIQLSGMATSQYEVRQILIATRTVIGVTEIVNKLEISPKPIVDG